MYAIEIGLLRAVVAIVLTAEFVWGKRDGDDENPRICAICGLNEPAFEGRRHFSGYKLSNIPL